MRLSVISLAVAACLAGQAVMAEDLVKIGVEGNYPPFSQVAADGKLSGFDIDIANALCAKMAVKCELVQQEWDGMIPALNARKFDMIVASMTITDKRKEVVDFSDPYYDVPSRFVAREGSFAGYSPQELAGKTIIVLRNSPRAEYLAANYPDSKLLQVDREPAVYMELAAGRGDIAFGSSVVSAEAFLKQPEGKGYAQVGEPITLTDSVDGGVGIAIRKGEAELAGKVNKALAEIMQDGSYAKMASNYFDFDITPAHARN
ncbi:MULTISPECIES: transporter substrate-binding domain-containing protein [unclassified Paracoccus (in: a-proteobacteria)]|uniref:transporter substrate-binding domain-containing protein n=1 Tax=unclassified Paracoccus (in: a-proteobacteria) TaxID=2688777 RepID=UPI0012B3A65E|nr:MULTISPECIES: transporter substrate-binding domain-containing protein [unclassified Paracoccus (in: a-proteobacteria)]UXU76435.1 transporter substrate-binding domain-containing protein [Paracoccus sp. SMMA_5]UXU82227.1 transporter substrate-binding domain-containing protein [Paracoccus sp. SMMA_5_TC]